MLVRVNDTDYNFIDGDIFCYTRKEPVGVVGQIIPVSIAKLSMYVSYSHVSSIVIQTRQNLQMTKHIPVNI